MGYVHDTQFSQFHSPSDFSFTAGTWTQTIASNVHKTVRTATAAAFTFSLPIKIPANAAALKGCYLKSIDLWYKIATADLTDFASLGLDKSHPHRRCGCPHRGSRHRHPRCSSSHRSPAQGSARRQGHHHPHHTGVGRGQ